MRKIPEWQLPNKRSFSFFETCKTNSKNSNPSREERAKQRKRRPGRKFIFDSDEELMMSSLNGGSTLQNSQCFGNSPEHTFWKRDASTRHIQPPLASGAPKISRFAEKPGEAQHVCGENCRLHKKKAEKGLSCMVFQSIFNCMSAKIKRLEISQIPGFSFCRIEARRQRGADCQEGVDSQFFTMTFCVKGMSKDWRDDCPLYQFGLKTFCKKKQYHFDFQLNFDLFYENGTHRYFFF